MTRPSAHRAPTGSRNPFELRASTWLASASTVLVALSACARPIATRAGNPAPDFAAQHVDGRPFQLSELRGRVVVLDIWAAWCDGCEDELPVLDALASRIRSLGATVVSVSVDEDPTKALALLRARTWSMTVLYDPQGRAGDAYRPSKLPAVYVIGGDGQVLDARFSLKPRDIAEIETLVRANARE